MADAAAKFAADILELDRLIGYQQRLIAVQGTALATAHAALLAGNVDFAIEVLGPTAAGECQLPDADKQRAAAEMRRRLGAFDDMLAYCKLMAANGDPDAVELVAKAEGCT